MCPKYLKFSRFSELYVVIYQTICSEHKVNTKRKKDTVTSNEGLFDDIMGLYQLID